MPVNVYLDTQDFSRLADAAAGRGEPDHAVVLQELLRLKASGAADFIYSSVHLSELLQYEGGGRELTLRKARMVKQLAGERALMNPTRLIAWEVARVAAELGLAPPAKSPSSPIMNGHGWHPGGFDLLFDIGSLKAARDEALEHELRQLSASAGAVINRKLRRRAKSEANRMRLTSLPDSAFDALVAKYPFPREIFTRTLARYFDGKISREEASAALLREMGDPEQFVIWYFELQTHSRDFPGWFRQAGEVLASALADLRRNLEPYAELPGAAEKYADLVSEAAVKLPRRLAQDASDEAAEFGVSSEVFASIVEAPELLSNAPFFRRLRALLSDYIHQHSVFRQQARKPQRGDGGDLFHSLALPYCDLWRGDAYFAGLVRTHSLPGDAEVVPRLIDLPAAIEARAL